MPHTLPKLHNAAWPGLVGKEPGSENPPIDLDTMLDYTAKAESDGQKFDGIDLFLFDPHVSIDASDDELKRLADKVQKRGLVVGSVVAPVWPPTGGGSAMDEGEGRASFLKQVEKGCRIAKTLREIGIRPYGVVRIDSASGPADWAKDPAANQKRIAETFRQACDIAAAHGEKLAAEGEICWGGMHSWKSMLELLDMVGRPETLGFQADMAHTLLYLMGYNAPDAGLLPQGFDFKDEAAFDAAYKKMTDALTAVDDRLPRRSERRDGLRQRQSRQDRTSLPSRRSQRQARHRQAGGLLAPRRKRQAHDPLPTHLLGRLHVPEQRDAEAGHVEQDPGCDGRGARGAWLGVKEVVAAVRPANDNEVSL